MPSISFVLLILYVRFCSSFKYFCINIEIIHLGGFCMAWVLTVCSDPFPFMEELLHPQGLDSLA